MIRMVADLGNTRLKWGQAQAGGVIDSFRALPIDDENVWDCAWQELACHGRPSQWWASTVNPAAAERFERFMAGRQAVMHWVRSANDVPIAHRLERPESTGADRALAVLAALRHQDEQGPGIVISCGTAITVDRIEESGAWDGGAIAPGLRAVALALHQLAAQLPVIDRFEPVAAWGRSTMPAMSAGLFWGAVGTIRELVSKQTVDDGQKSAWRIWTGGDAPSLAPWIDGENALVVPDLVLRGLGCLAWNDPQ